MKCVIILEELKVVAILSASAFNLEVVIKFPFLSAL